MEWYLRVLQNYVNFSGRARRKEYWMFALFNFVFSFLLAIAGLMLFGSNASAAAGLVDLYTFAVLLPSIAVSVRRLHDTGKSGWWLLIAFVPLIGAFILLVWYCMDSETGVNQWGESKRNNVRARYGNLSSVVTPSLSKPRSRRLRKERRPLRNAQTRSG